MRSSTFEPGLRSLSVRTRKFPTKRSKNRLEVALCFLFSLVGVTKIKCDHDSSEVEFSKTKNRILKTKNRNGSINKFKNLGYDR